MIPTIEGLIDRRILINYRVEKEVLERFLPEPFKPKLVEGYGVAGICLIRLKQIRPKGLPGFLGISSENGAHRIAVEWEDNGTKEGVYVYRRDTSARLNTLVGGRLFPGVHHYSKFTSVEENGNYQVNFANKDGTYISIEGTETDIFPSTSLFRNVQEASTFFEKGSLGYSPQRNNRRYDGLELRTLTWNVKPLGVSEVRSSFFEDESIFPKGSIQFDNALLMKDIKHQWHSAKDICVENFEK